MDTKQAICAVLRGGKETESYVESVVRRVWNVEAEEFDSAIEELIRVGVLSASAKQYADMRVGFVELSRNGV